LGYGDLNDFRKDFVITRETTVIVRKDNQKFAEIPIRISGESRVMPAAVNGTSRVKYLVVKARGHRILLGDGETLDLVRGDRLKILDTFPSHPCPSAFKVNFKGFVGDKEDNTGEDRGYDINTGVDLMNRYSLGRAGKIYEIIASGGENVLGRFFVSLNPPELDYLILEVNDQNLRVLRPGGTISLSRSDELGLEEVQTNLYSKNGIHLSVNGHELTPGAKQGVAMLVGDQVGKWKHDALIKKGPLVLGRVHINVQ
ncbi:MAG: hypothetical protein SV775_13510, partial [Thermodesulfobacteriota bacterium]|nr:hypothetical protein [Thermodesulfobacteriota bacterium]